MSKGEKITLAEADRIASAHILDMASLFGRAEIAGSIRRGKVGREIPRQWRSAKELRFAKRGKG